MPGTPQPAAQDPVSVLTRTMKTPCFSICTLAALLLLALSGATLRAAPDEIAVAPTAGSEAFNLDESAQPLKPPGADQ